MFYWQNNGIRLSVDPWPIQPQVHGHFSSVGCEFHLMESVLNLSKRDWLLPSRLYPAPTLGDSQLPVTLALGDPVPSCGFQGHLYSHVYTHTHINIVKTFLILKKLSLWPLRVKVGKPLGKTIQPYILKFNIYASYSSVSPLLGFIPKKCC